ncbi:MAG: ATPase, partial [Candidatus Pacebacteria bacterium CG_4_9_14_0_2_um_filter_36_8]
MDYNRQIYIKIQEMLFCEQVLIIYGPRQVGKTTLSKKILTDNQNIQTKYINCESLAVRELLSKETPSELKAFIGEAKLIVLDEAQQIENIGLKLKLLIDNYPELQIIATGSSSFDLANKVNEPLTGRKKTFYLYPLAQNE